MFEAAIPGQSLTSPPKKYPYERPPEIADPEEALQMHLDRLSKPEVEEALLQTLELDVDIVTLTEGILRGAVAGGLHSIDVSLVIAPVVHKYIKRLADDAGIEYEEGLEDKKKKEQQRKAIEEAMAYKKVSKRLGSMGDKKSTPVEEPMSAPQKEPQPEGILARRMK